jgi:hypothetical protein
MYEKFCHTQCELIDHHVTSAHDEATLAIFEFIEGWYNGIAA